MGLILLVITAVVGFEEVAKWDQRRDSWQGTIERSYEEANLLSRRHRKKQYIDVRGDDGQLHTARIWSSYRWKRARVGDWVVKKAGNLDPE